MARPEHVLSIGHIRRAHGLGGEVVVRLSTNRTERLDPGSVLYTEDAALVVSTARPKGEDWLVRFDGITDRTAAEELAATELSAAPIDDAEELWVHELIGANVVDQLGVERGTVESVEANPASDLLVLDSGHLVPLTFVVDVDRSVITVDVPEGLFEL